MPVGSGGSGGGASAGDIRAGGAYFEIVGKDGLSKTFDVLKAKAHAFEEGIKKIGGRDFAQGLRGGGLGGGTGALLGGFGGGLVGGLVGGSLSGLAEKAGQAVADWVTGAKELERTHARIAERIESAGREIDAAAKRALEWRNALSEDEPGRMEKLASLARERFQWHQRFLEIDQKLQKAGSRNSAIGRDKDLNTLLEMRRGTAEYAAFENELRELDAIRKDPSALLKARNEALRKQAELAEQIIRLEDRSKDPAFVGEINKATFALKEQIETWGLTGTAAQRAILVMRGAIKDMLKDFDKEAAEIKRLGELSKTPPPFLTPVLSVAGMIGERAPLFDLRGKMTDALDEKLQAMGQFERAVVDLARNNPALAKLGTDLELLKKEAIATDLAIRNRNLPHLSPLTVPFMMLGQLIGAMPPPKPWAQVVLEEANRPRDLPPWLAAPLGIVAMLPELIDSMKSVSRGGFGGQQAQQRFGFGDMVQQKMLETQKKIADNTVPKAVGDAVAAALALVLVLR